MYDIDINALVHVMLAIDAVSFLCQGQQEEIRIRANMKFTNLKILINFNLDFKSFCG